MQEPDDIDWLDSFAEQHNATATMPLDDPARAAPMTMAPELEEIDGFLDTLAAQDAGVTLGDLGFKRMPAAEAQALLDLAAKPREANEAVVPGKGNIPLVGYGFTLKNQAQALAAQARVQKGKGTAEDERLYLGYLVDAARESTTGAGVLDIAWTIATSIPEVMAGAGVVSLAKVGGKKAMKAAGAQLMSEALEKAAAKATERVVGRLALQAAPALAAATGLQELVPQLLAGSGLPGTDGMAEGGAWTLRSVQTLLGREMTDTEAQEIIDAKNAILPVLLERGGGLMEGMIRQSITMGAEGAGPLLGKLPIVKQIDLLTGMIFAKLSGKVGAGGWSKAALEIAQQHGFGSEGAEEVLDAVTEAAAFGDKTIAEALLEVAEQAPEFAGALALVRGGVASAQRTAGIMRPSVTAPATALEAKEGGDLAQATPEATAEGVAASVEPAAPTIAPEVRAADVEAFGREAGATLRAVEPDTVEEHAAVHFMRRYGVDVTVAEAEEGADLESLPAAFYPGGTRAVVLRGQPQLVAAAVHEGLHAAEAQWTPEQRAEFGAALKEISPEFMSRVESFVRSQPLYKNVTPEVLAEELRTNVATMLGGLTSYLTTPQGRADFELAYGKQPGPFKRALGALYDWLQERIRLLPQRKRALARARLRVARGEGDPALVAQRALEALESIRPVRAGEAGAGSLGVSAPGAPRAGLESATASAAETVAPRPPKTPADRRANRAARKARAAERVAQTAAETQAATTAAERRSARAARRRKPEVLTDAADVSPEQAAMGLGPDQGMRFAARLDSAPSAGAWVTPELRRATRGGVTDADGLGLPKYVRAVVDTGPQLASEGWEDSFGGAANVDDLGNLLVVHLTDKPDALREYLAGGADLADGRDASKWGDLGRGLYGSAAPWWWTSRANDGAPAVPLRLVGKFARLDRTLVESEAEALRAAGFDGAMVRASMATTPQTVVWNRSAIAEVPPNRAAADEVRFAPRPPKDALVANFLDDAEILDLSSKALRAVSDEFLAVERWQKAAMALGASAGANPISAVRRFFGKVAVKGEPIKEYAEKIGDHLRRSKIALADAGLYAEARHTREAREDFLQKHHERVRLAEERKALVRAAKDLPRDAQFERDLRALEKRIADLGFVPIVIPDGHTAEHYFHEVADVTGMKTSEAEAKLAEFEALPGYKRLGRMIDALNRRTLREQLDYQLITPAQFDSRRQQFSRYVPLRTAEVDKPERPRGSGFNVRGPETMRRKGRKSLASNPLVMSLAQAMKTVERSEKNAVGHELRDFLQENRAVLGSSERDVALNDEGKPALDSDEFYLKVAGRDVAIKIENPDVARALKRLGLPQIPKALRLYGTLFGYWKLAATSLSPEFLLTNFARDVETALVNVSSVARDLDLKGLRRDMLRGVPAAGRTAWQAARGKPVTTGLGDYFEEYRQAGGKIGSFGSASFEAIEQSMESTMSTTAAGKVRRAVAPLWSVIEDANGAVEQANRFSLFVALRQRGVPVNDAALAARRITVDFSQKGEFGTALSLIYAFFSAAVGGTRRLAETMRSPVGRRIAGSLVGLGFAQTLANYYASGDDDDGRRFYEKIGEGEKERTAIFMVPGFDEPLKVPLGYGLNVFHGAGRIFAETVLGMHTEGEAAELLLLTALNGFAPIGAAPSLAQFVSPTALDPAVQIIENQNFMGNPITPHESAFGAPGPRHAKSFRATSPLAVDMARALNSISGGDSVKPGAINVSGDEIEHLYEFAGAGVARFISRAFAASRAVVAGESFSEVAQVAPFLRVVYGARTEFADSDTFYDALDTIEYEKRYLKEAVESGDAERVRELRERFRPTLALENAGKRVQEQTKALRDEAYEGGKVVAPEKLREANRIMQEWNRRYLEALSAK